MRTVYQRTSSSVLESHDMGDPIREARVGDLVGRGRPPGQRLDACGVGEDRQPIVLVTGIHAAAKDAGIYLRKQLERVVPVLDPVAVRPFNQPVERDLKRSDDLLSDMTFLSGGLMARVAASEPQ
jgi:hypothetical protein